MANSLQDYAGGGNAFDAWITRGSPQYSTGARETDQGPVNNYDSFLSQIPLEESYWRRLGYMGPMDEGSVRQWLDSQGLQYGVNPTTQQNALIGPDGSPVSGSEYSVKDTGNFFRDALAVMAAGYFGGNALAGAYGGGTATLGTIPAGAGEVAPLVAAGAETAPAIGAVPAVGGAVGGGGTSGIVGAGIGAGSGLGGSGAGMTAAGTTAGGTSTGLGSTGLGTTAAAGGGGMGWAEIATQLASTAYQASQARKAAGQANAGTQAGVDEQRRQFDLNRSDLAPLREALPGAVADYTKIINTPTTAADAMADPGYAWAQEQGNRGLDAKFAASGGRISGAAMKAGVRFNQGNATQFFQQADQRRENRAARLAALMGIGQAATATGAQMGQNTANNVSAAYGNMGTTNAASTLAQGNIWGNQLNSLAALYGRKYSDPGKTDSPGG